MSEDWKPIPGKPDYLASSLGRIKALSRTVPTWNGYKTLPEIIMALRDRNGYAACKLGNVHTLVASAFLAPDAGRKYVNHIDGDKKNNRLENLERCTATENMQHAWRTGLCNQETRDKMSKKAKLRTGRKNPCWRGFIDILRMDESLVMQCESLKAAVDWLRSNGAPKAAKSNIYGVCVGKARQAYGYIFRLNREIRA